MPDLLDGQTTEMQGSGSKPYVLKNMVPGKPQIQFSLSFKDEEITLPGEPATIPPDLFFCWPVRIDIGGVNLVYASAEIYCRLNAGEIQYVIFKETKGMPAEFVFDEGVEVVSTGTVTRTGGRTHVSRISPRLDVAIRIRTASGNVSHPRLEI